MCGVTIVRKVDREYQLVARYDLDTDSVAKNIANTIMYDEGGKNQTINEYQQAANSYYRHIDYLIDTLKVENELIFEKVNSKKEIGDKEYDTNGDLQTRINELYSYRSEDKLSAEVCYGTPWSECIAERLKRDLSGTEVVKLNGKYYGYQKYEGDKDNLLEYMQDKKFKEYIIEVSNGEITEEDILQGNDSAKLEIIYVEQET